MTFDKENIARFGLASLGFVYVLVGVLTALAAFNWGGEEVGTKGAIGFLSDQRLAKFLLVITAIGLFSYAFWRFYQTFNDSRHLGTGLNALVTRAGYFTGGLFYGFLGVVSIRMFFGGQPNEQPGFIAEILNSDYGSFVGAAFSIGLAGKAIFEIYFIISNQFKKNVKSSEMTPKVKSLLLNFGVIGHSARGFVFAIMAFLTARTAVSFRDKEVSTLTNAFNYLDYKFGAFILAIVALGLSCYGLYMFVKAKYLYIGMK